MKRFFLITILLLGFNFYGQPPRGGGDRPSQNRQGNQNREVRKFNASDAAGIFFYDIDKAIKKIKIKDDNTKFSVSKALKNYNYKIKEISFINSEKFIELSKVVNTLMKTGKRNSNNSSENRNLNNGGDSIREKVRETLRPVREKVRENEIELNNNLKDLLSEKQFKKWLKYQKKKKESLKPKKPQNNQRQGNRQNGGGMRRQ